MRGGRDYINDMANVSECNPFGLKRNINACNLVKNTDLEPMSVRLVEDGKTTIRTPTGSSTPGQSTIYADLSDAPYLGFPIYHWTVTNGTIKSGGKKGDKFVEVETFSSETTTFSVSLVVTDTKYTMNASEDFIHYRELYYPPLINLQMNETVAGSCNYPYLGTCIAESTYTITTTSGNPVSYDWVVVGATITSGEGTDSITVETDSDTTDSITVSCSIFNGYEYIVLSDTYSHTRGKLPSEFAETFVLDATTIPIWFN